jgi:hypothetical protein
MPRYFFHIRLRNLWFYDAYGMELPNLTTARRVGLLSARWPLLEFSNSVPSADAVLEIWDCAGLIEVLPLSAITQRADAADRSLREDVKVVQRKRGQTDPPSSVPRRTESRVSL